IPSDLLPFIFEPLFTTKKSGGTGLGLAVVYQVIERHDGEVWADSALGEGSAFHIRIPLNNVAVTGPKQGPATASRHLPTRLAVVEDDENVGHGLVAVLEAEGIEVDWIRTGNEVVPRLVRNIPDAVILDVGLPDIDGVAVFHEIVRRWPE